MLTLSFALQREERHVSNTNQTKLKFPHCKAFLPGITIPVSCFLCPSFHNSPRRPHFQSFIAQNSSCQSSQSILDTLWTSFRPVPFYIKVKSKGEAGSGPTSQLYSQFFVSKSPCFSQKQFCFTHETHTTRTEGSVGEHVTKNPHRNIYSHLMIVQTSPVPTQGLRAEMTFGVSGRAAPSKVNFYCPAQMFSFSCF